MNRTALVLGGSGALGSEVVRRLVARDVRTAFTFHQGRDRADALARDTGAHALALDLADRDAIRAAVAKLAADGVAPDLLVHCAAASRPCAFEKIGDADWDTLHAVGPRAAFTAAQALAPSLRARGGDIVLAGALDRTQSVAAPIHFAAAQGALAATAMALAKELGPANVRVNMVAFGPLDGGMARDLDAKLLADYRTFSALRRTGTVAEAATFLTWLALENTWLTAKVIPVNGGL